MRKRANRCFLSTVFRRRSGFVIYLYLKDSVFIWLEKDAKF